MHQLLAFDLDDTLLLPSGEISPRARAALNTLHEAGVAIALASGRMLATMLPIADTLPFAPAIVSYNGAQVNLGLDKVLYHRPVPVGLSNRVLDFAQEHNLHLHFYHDDRLFTTNVDNWKAQIYRELTGAHLEYEPDLDRFRDLEPTKLLIVDEEGKIAHLQDECRAMFQDELTVTLSKPIFLEFLHPTVNKGAGFQALCRALEIPLENTAAFGDAFNDIEMLQAAGTAIAMGNAFDEIKAVADFVCESNENDGVARVLESWIEARLEIKEGVA